MIEVDSFVKYVTCKDTLCGCNYTLQKFKGQVGKVTKIYFRLKHRYIVINFPGQEFDAHEDHVALVCKKYKLK